MALVVKQKNNQTS